MRVPLAGGRNGTPERRAAFVQQLSERVAGLPGVHSAGVVTGLPLTGLLGGAAFVVDGRPAPEASQRPMALVRSATPDYFRTMGIPLIAGRFFAASDDPNARPAIIVNQTLARRFWPGAGAIGGRLVIDAGAPRVAEVVGVVGDVKPDRIENEDWPTIYNAFAQVPTSTTSLVIRTTGAPLSLATAVQREVRTLDPGQPVADVRTMEDLVSQAVSGARFNTGLLTVFAVVAFVLAAVGIYGVVSYDVTERLNEIGIRMALGAQPADLLRMVLGQGARMSAYGIAAGLVLSFGLTRLMATMLFGVNTTDAYTFGAISILLAVVALLASYLPSRRAMALNPVSALRHE
jgi:putative ABC transport system permease protein